MAVVGPSGYEEFLWKGQLRYRCRRKWPNGARCTFDTYNLRLMRDHEQSIHGARVAVPQPSMLFDADGHKIKTAAQPAQPDDPDPDVPEEFRNYRIKK